MATTEHPPPSRLRTWMLDSGERVMTRPYSARPPMR